MASLGDAVNSYEIVEERIIMKLEVHKIEVISDQYCFLFTDALLPCLTMSEMASWFQAFFSALAVLVVVFYPIYQDRQRKLDDVNATKKFSTILNGNIQSSLKRVEKYGIKVVALKNLNLQSSLNRLFEVRELKHLNSESLIHVCALVGLANEYVNYVEANKNSTTNVDPHVRFFSELLERSDNLDKHISAIKIK